MELPEKSRAARRVAAYAAISFVAMHGMSRIACQTAGKRSHRAQRRDAHEKIFHEIARAQVQDVEARDAIQLLLHVVQANDGTRFLRVLRADAAERDDIGNACICDRRGVGIRNAFLMGAQVLLRNILGDHEIDGCSAVESFRHRRDILHVADERFGALLRERLEFLRVAPDHANLLALRKQRFRRWPSRMPRRSRNDDHYSSVSKTYLRLSGFLL